MIQFLDIANAIGVLVLLAGGTWVLSAISFWFVELQRNLRRIADALEKQGHRNDR